MHLRRGRGKLLSGIARIGSIGSLTSRTLRRFISSIDSLDFNKAVIATLLLGLAAFSIFCAWVVTAYRGALLWPSLATGFVATGLGVFLALVLEREVDRRRELARSSIDAEEERERRRAEIRLGFAPVAEELRALAVNLEALRLDLQRAVPYPAADLPTEAWDAARLRLGGSVSDFELLANIGQFYGRIRRLQGWIELRAQAALHGRIGELAAIDKRLATVVDDSATSIPNLRRQVRSQIAEPSIDVAPLLDVGFSVTPATK